MAYAKAKPGQLNYAAAGLGTPPHLTMERLRVAAGFTGQVVPFKGAPEALTEVLAGRVDVYFTPAAAGRASSSRAGSSLPLAVSSVKRVAALPNVPTTTESGFPNSDFDFYIQPVRAKEDATRCGRADPRADASKACRRPS